MTTLSNLQTTPRIPEHGLKQVGQSLKREAARQHCVDNFGGDLIQQDPRLYTREGRQEISERLNLRFGYYHTGIRRDESNLQVWRRSSDGAEVQLEGWWPGDPRSEAWRKFLYLYFSNNSYKNTIFNTS